MRWAAAVLVTLLLIVPGAADEAMPRLGEFIPATPPVSAPAIAFADLAGRPHALAEFRGKPVLINLWATWCHPCLEEMPSLIRLQQRLGDRLRIVAVSEDRGGSKAVAPFLAAHKLTAIAAYLDPESTLEQAFKVAGLPTSILIDRHGMIVGRVTGAADWTSARMLTALQPFVADDGVVKTSLRPAPR